MTSTPSFTTPLHNLAWERSASGCALRAKYRGLHVSVWKRPQGGGYHFTVSGRFPTVITSSTVAIGYLWDRLLSKVGAS